MTLFDQALAHHQQGRLDDAARLYESALAAEPSHLNARHMLGVIRAQQGRGAEAHDLLAAVVAAAPGDAMAQVNFGNVLDALGRRDAAVEAFTRALVALPGQPLALFNRARVLAGLRRHDEALADYDALAALGADPQIQFHRGDVLQRLGRYDQAVAAYDAALALAPDFAQAWNNRGVALQNLGRLDAALASFARAGAMPEAQLNEGLCRLLQQDFARGWPLFEARLAMPGLGEARDYPQPVWTGREDISGKTLFVHVRRGLGDAIQFYRYAVAAQARGAKVILSLNDPLLPLLSRAEPQVEMIGLNQVPASFDYHVALMSLPFVLGSGDVLGGDIPPSQTLSPEPERAARWKARLGHGGTRIAISWQGDSAALGSEGKAFPLAALAPVAAIPGVRLISLQKNEGAEQLRAAGFAVESFDDLDADGAFLDSAAIIAACDLTITSDTAIAHLAGAMGAPVWTALKFVPEWRWFLGRADTPWYPSMRLYRQAAPGDWASVFDAIASDLKAGSRTP